MECYKVENATEFGGRTLVGSYGEFPRKGGNCFDLKVEDTYIRIINFKYENLKELIARGLTWPIKIKRILPDLGLVMDERIPDHWFQDRYCEVCCPVDFLNDFQKKKHERAVARGDREILPGGYVRSRIGPSPVFDYVGEKKVDLTKWRVILDEDVKQFGEDGQEIPKS